MKKAIIILIIFSLTKLSIGGNLIGWWKFNEGKGDIAYDSSGNRNNGGIKGARWVKGRKGYGLYFDGIDDVVWMDKPITTKDGITVMAWCKLDKDFSGGGAIMGAGWHLQGRHWLILTRKAIDYHYSYGPKAHGTQALQDVLLPLNKWIHIAIVDDYKTGELFYYLNGKLLGKRKRNSKIVPLTNATLTIGRCWCSTFPFKGVIDEVKIYDGVLSGREIKKEMRR